MSIFELPLPHFISDSFNAQCLLPPTSGLGHIHRQSWRGEDWEPAGTLPGHANLAASLSGQGSPLREWGKGRVLLFLKSKGITLASWEILI